MLGEGRDWIPAYAGMTKGVAGMTVGERSTLRQAQGERGKGTG